MAHRRGHGAWWSPLLLGVEARRTGVARDVLGGYYLIGDQIGGGPGPSTMVITTMTLVGRVARARRAAVTEARMRNGQPDRRESGRHERAPASRSRPRRRSAPTSGDAHAP